MILTGKVPLKEYQQVGARIVDRAGCIYLVIEAVRGSDRFTVSCINGAWYVVYLYEDTWEWWNGPSSFDDRIKEFLDFLDN